MAPDSESRLDRRRFLTGLSASALVLNAHGVLAGAPSTRAAESVTTGADGDSGPRILALELLTAASLEDMAAFYGDALGLPVRAGSGDRIRVTAGATEITFVSTSELEAPPFYHFAFNIPENKILAARSWQLERTPLFLTPDNLRDARYPNDVRHFRNWNAHSVFFWDPAGNVVEYIARHTLGNPAEGPFSSRDILYASEIAFVADDVPGFAAHLEPALSLPRYGNAYEVFHASGDERGLLLTFERGRELGDALRGRSAPAEVFHTRAAIRGPVAGTHALAGGPFEIEVLAAG